MKKHGFRDPRFGYQFRVSFLTPGYKFGSVFWPQNVDPEIPSFFAALLTTSGKAMMQCLRARPVPKPAGVVGRQPAGWQHHAPISCHPVVLGQIGLNSLRCDSGRISSQISANFELCIKGNKRIDSCHYQCEVVPDQGPGTHSV